MQVKKLLLIILDGWGIAPPSKGNAISNANTPNLDKLISRYPHSKLKASGEAVGLPPGIMGNSEVGHLTIGAGRIIKSDLLKINEVCTRGNIGKEKMVQEAFEFAKKKGKKLHFIGLLSDAGVHSMNKHLYALCDAAHREGLKNVYIHAFSDGRDTNPTTGVNYVAELEKYLEHSSGQLATLIGRYYGMDRDQRWKRTKQAYDLMTKGKGKKSHSFIKTINNFYKQGITDEFLKGIVRVDKNNKPIALIEEGDVVICFNFRTDRLRQLTRVLSQNNFLEFKVKDLKLYYYTMTTYNRMFKGVKTIFSEENISNTLGEVISKHHLKQLRAAETEKYPHVSFFFSGRQQKEFINEDRLIVPSPKVATYDLQPEMSAKVLSRMVARKMLEDKYKFICLNFANADMVGHTSVYSSVIKAVEIVDTCVGDLIKVAQKEDYRVLIIADHGNAEELLNSDGSISTKHTTNLVPCILVDKDYKKINNGGLSNVAPTILKIMNLDIPLEMTGKTLI